MTAISFSAAVCLTAPWSSARPGRARSPRVSASGKPGSRRTALTRRYFSGVVPVPSARILRQVRDQVPLGVVEVPAHLARRQVDEHDCFAEVVVPARVRVGVPADAGPEPQGQRHPGQERHALVPFGVPRILGRTCDRPCEPACRRVRVEKEPVAICRLKRVAADYKDDIRARLPKPAAKKNGKRIALVGGGPASLTVARDLAPLGYQCVVFDSDPKAGGMIRTQIPKFRLPDSVIDEECGYILDLGVEFRAGKRIDSLKGLSPRAGTQSSSVPGRRAVVISISRAARKQPKIFTSASIGSLRFPLGTSARSVNVLWCSVAAILQWIAAVRREDWAASKSTWSCARDLRK